MTGPCNTGVNCPVNGLWGTWQASGTCSVTCGSGNEMYTRLCNSPAPAHGGADCVGTGAETRTCDTNVECPIDGGWGEWSVLGTCSETCGTGSQTYTRQCDDPVPQNNGLDCQGEGTDERPCYTGVICPINGQWGPWTASGSCSETCGEGVQIWERRCNNPAPDFGGLECEGDEDMDLRTCSTGIECPVIINGSWGSWIAITECTATCGGGEQNFQRACDNPTPNQHGADCEGANLQSRTCNTEECPVHGMWSQWESFGPCSATCEGGIQTRTRTCTNPVPAFGGLLCNGISSQTQSCNHDISCGNNTDNICWFNLIFFMLNV